MGDDDGRARQGWRRRRLHAGRGDARLDRLGAVIDDPTAYGLDFAFTATFLALLLSMWKGRGDLVPWLAGGAIAIGVSMLVPGTWYIIAGGLGGSLLGAFLQHRMRDAA